MKIYKNLENFVGVIPNFSYFFSSNVISYFFSFFFIILFARHYSPQAFGEFTIGSPLTLKDVFTKIGHLVISLNFSINL